MKKEGLLLAVLAILDACAPAQPNIAPPTSPRYIPPPTPTAERFIPTLTPTKPLEQPTAVIYVSPVPPSPTLKSTYTRTPTIIPTATAIPPTWCLRTPEWVGTPELGHEHVVSFGSSFTDWFLYWLKEDKKLAVLFDDLDIGGKAFPGESAQQLKTRFIDNQSTIHVVAGRKNILLLQTGSIDMINLRDPTRVLGEIEQDAIEIQGCFKEFDLVIQAPIPNKTNKPSLQLTFAKSLEERMSLHGWRVSNPGPLLVTSDGKLKEELYADDLHLKSEGYELIAPIMKQAIIGTSNK